MLYRVLIDGVEAPLIVELPDQEVPEIVFDPDTNYGDALMTIIYHVFFHKTVSSGRGVMSFVPVISFTDKDSILRWSFFSAVPQAYASV
ncbi:MAG: hypothetical protein ACYCQJ_14360 [Nitrososphaerales archaeon]